MAPDYFGQPTPREQAREDAAGNDECVCGWWTGDDTIDEACDWHAHYLDETPPEDET